MKSFQQITEETTKKLAILFGRMNPPTKGHEENVNGLKQMASKQSADHLVIASHSVDAKKNPLTPDVKLKHLKRAFPETNIITSSREQPTILHHATEAHKKGYTHLTVVAGSDRVEEYKKLLNHYNGKTHDEAGQPFKHGAFNFKKIEVKSTGERKQGVSGTDMRNHATNNNFDEFKNNLSSHMQKNDKHAKELFRDVRSGMGIHENVNHGLFKAIFVSGGPGSGKDIIIREAIAEQNAVEINSTIAINILNDKHKLFEYSRDSRREAIRNRMPLIITGTTNEQSNILAIREELEELGYETLMLFVNTTNESSKKRNEAHERVLSEYVRQQRWDVTQLVAEKYNQEFTKYLEFDNSLDLNEADDLEKTEKEEDISIIYEMSSWFFDTPVENEIAESWLIRHKKHNINKMFENFITKPTLEKGHTKYVPSIKTNSKTVFSEGASCTCRNNATYTGQFNKNLGSYKRFGLADNICPSCELVRRQGKPDDIKDGGITSNSGYTFGTYESRSGPIITTGAGEKESRFQQDADKEKARKQKYKTAEAGKVIKAAGVSPEYDTRGSGTVYPMSGLGNVTYREQSEYKYTNTAEVIHKSFSKFRKESIDSPSTEMGVTGGEYGPSNKEPMETLNKIPVNSKKKKNVKF